MKLVYLLGRQVLSKSLYQLPAYFNKNNSTKVAEAHVVYPVPAIRNGGLGFCREVTDFKSNEYHELRHLLFEYRDTAKMGHQRGVVDGIPGAHPFLSTRETTSPVAQRGSISERNIAGTFSSLFGISLLWFYFLHNFLQPVYGAGYSFTSSYLKSCRSFQQFRVVVRYEVLWQLIAMINTEDIFHQECSNVEIVISFSIYQCITTSTVSASFQLSAGIAYDRVQKLNTYLLQIKNNQLYIWLPMQDAEHSIICCLLPAGQK